MKSIFMTAVLASYVGAANAQLGVDPVDVQHQVKQAIAAVDKQIYGTPAAARKTVAEFLNLMYDADPAGILIEEPTAQGAWLIFQSSIPRKKCVLSLAKSAAGTKYGWEVKQHQCHAANK